MCSAFRKAGARHNAHLIVCGVALAVLIFTASATATELKVCADPDALPFSNHAQQGFENRIAIMLARDIHAHLSYTWQRIGRGFVRNIVNKGGCDVVLGIPTSFRQLLTTEPYYRSTYVFVTRRKRNLHLTSFDDPRLRSMSVGVQVIGEEYAPPAMALGRRGLVANIVGFATNGSDAGSLIDAVRTGRVDAAVMWGPQAGYFARKHPGGLELTPVPEVDIPALPFTFMISMGVRKGNTELQRALNRFLERRNPEIERVLRSYGVPLLPIGSETAALRNEKVGH